MQYKNTLRIILKNEISKEFILYYTKNNIEGEIIVTPNKLKNVEIITENEIE